MAKIGTHKNKSRECPNLEQLKQIINTGLQVYVYYLFIEKILYYYIKIFKLHYFKIYINIYFYKVTHVYISQNIYMSQALKRD